MSGRKRKSFTFSKTEMPKLFSWATGKDYFLYCNGNNYPSLYGSFPEKLFAGKRDFVECNENSLSDLNHLINDNRDWLFGYFSYELKNEIEALSSNNPSSVPVNHLGFYVPETIIHFELQAIIIESVFNPDEVYSEIIRCAPRQKVSGFNIEPIISNTPKWQYIDHIGKIKASIVEGEFYELNYCMEFTSRAISFDPFECYQKINAISPMPFSSLAKFKDIFLICTSPERFLKKDGSKIISQPIKGTIRRSFDRAEDELLKNRLKTSEKEQSENLMIVDLVRNDLAQSAQTGSVQVEELFGIYTFKKIHQMISTVSAQCKKTTDPTEIIKNAFPMGSMTGAPKIRVMEEIELLEQSARGLYSGSIGFFEPDGNFDLNVVIRSIVYHAGTNMISFHVGSAITCDSDPEYEYNECLLKAESLLEALG